MYTLFILSFSFYRLIQRPTIKTSIFLVCECARQMAWMVFLIELPHARKTYLRTDKSSAIYVVVGRNGHLHLQGVSIFTYLCSRCRNDNKSSHQFFNNRHFTNVITSFADWTGKYWHWKGVRQIRDWCVFLVRYLSVSFQLTTDLHD